jgi:hypothetical protein
LWSKEAEGEWARREWIGSLMAFGEEFMGHLLHLEVIPHFRTQSNRSSH